MGSMTLRRRFAVSCAAAVALVVVSGSLAAYLLVRSAMREEVDDSLRSAMGNAAAKLVAAPGTAAEEGIIPSGPYGGPVFLYYEERLVGQALGGTPATAPPKDQSTRTTPETSGVQQQRVVGGPAAALPDLPRLEDYGVPLEKLQAVAEGRISDFFTDAYVNGVHMRVYVAQGAGGDVRTIVRPLTEVDKILGPLRLSLGVLSVIAVALAAAVGWVASRAAVRPVTQLTVTAEHVARTRDLSRRIAQHGDDEVGRLAATFNEMLAALDASQRSQRQLVADASHELRTPLTSLRTNLEVLAADRLPPADRERLRADLVTQLEEFTELVGDLVDLARDEEPGQEPATDLRFDDLVAAAVARARSHAPGIEFTCDLAPTVVSGVAARLDRAVANLLGNAAKFSPPGGVVEVRVCGGELTVRDHGPGIAPEALPHVFDRFYRAPEARSQAGSGLGLAIVRQVAQAHRGTVSAANARGGGAVLRLALPATAPVPAASGTS
jgi:two-component system sensor histidine kinase MprB